MSNPNASQSQPNESTYIIKFGTQTYTIQISTHAVATLLDLQSAIEAETGVLVRQQKLLYKGKVLVVPNAHALNQSSPGPTLAEVGIIPGERIMLLATPSAMKNAQTMRNPRKSVGQLAVTAQLATNTKHQRKENDSLSFINQRTASWKKTGIVGLRDLKLSDIPADVFEVGAGVRVLDCGNNHLTSISTSPFSKLVSLEKLRLSFNELSGGGIPWTQLADLPRLAILALDHNRLTHLHHPQETQIHDATSWMSTAAPHLVKLTLDHNQLTTLPDSISCLTSLKALTVASNRLTELPAGLANCKVLEELDASDNPIRTLPDQWSDTVTFKGLLRLETLMLDATLIADLPPSIFQAPSLKRLSLHGCPITLDQLASIPGYDEYEARRQAVTNKQQDLKVLKDRGGGYDAGADSQEWERWRFSKR